MPETKTQILDIAEHLVRTTGYNSFSYADISEAVGISKAAVRHHFPAKADLGLALVRNFSDKMISMLQGIDKGSGNSF